MSLIPAMPIAYSDLEMITVLYHANCIDGIAAAAAVCDALTDSLEDIICIPVNYNEPLPEIQSKHVIFVDFCPTLDQLMALVEYHHVLVIDHHLTAKETLEKFASSDSDYKGNLETYIDMDHSGAVLTYKFFNRDCPVPDIYLSIEDRDLWKFELPYTKAITTYLYNNVSDIYDFETLVADWGTWTEKAIVQYAYVENQIRLICDNHTITDLDIAGNKVMVIQCPYTYVSEVADTLLKENNVDVVCCYVHDIFNDRVKLSFRSTQKGPAKQVAEIFHGGGHLKAAGSNITYVDFIRIVNKESGAKCNAVTV